MIVFATVTPKPEHYAEARGAVAAILDETRAEPGCRRFVLLESETPDGRLYLYEEWADEAAFRAHHDAAYTRAVYARYEAWLAQPPSLLTLRPVPPLARDDAP